MGSKGKSERKVLEEKGARVAGLFLGGGIERGLKDMLERGGHLDDPANRYFLFHLDDEEVRLLGAAQSDAELHALAREEYPDIIEAGPSAKGLCGLCASVDDGELILVNRFGHLAPWSR